MATIDEELGQLERDIRQLKIEYDQYFGGGRKRPPTEIEWRIELIVKRYGERNGTLARLRRRSRQNARKLIRSRPLRHRAASQHLPQRVFQRQHRQRRAHRMVSAWCAPSPIVRPTRSISCTKHSCRQRPAPEKKPENFPLPASRNLCARKRRICNRNRTAATWSMWSKPSMGR